jgi:hypothetical protein
MYFSIPKRSLSKLALTSIEVSWERQKERKEVVEIKINFPLHDALDWHFGDVWGGGKQSYHVNQCLSIFLSLSLSFFLSSILYLFCVLSKSFRERRKKGRTMAKKYLLETANTPRNKRRKSITIS